MKKVAVLIYDKFCNFEFSVALEMLAMAEKQITVFAKTLTPVCSEERLVVVAEKTIYELDIEEYDALLLTGSSDLREAAEDDDIISFVKRFNKDDIIIGAISIAPVLLLKAGMLKGKRFMVGVNRKDLLEEGFTQEDIAFMVGWDDNIEKPITEGYIKDGNIITSVSYGFVKWAMAFGRALGLEVYPKSFEYDT
ncbi:MAG: DJ-1/PfpI family protein [Oscillospiraceae bacterium]|nr:DJ-1/PfpI family protein [Oscillospiraceae bacterium]